MYLDQYRMGTEVKSSSHEGDTKNGRQAPHRSPQRGVEPKEKVGIPSMPWSLNSSKAHGLQGGKYLVPVLELVVSVFYGGSNLPVSLVS